MINFEYRPLLKTEKCVEHSRELLPAGYRISKAYEELSLRREFENVDVTETDAFKQLFGHYPDFLRPEIYDQWTDTFLRLPKGLNKEAYEINDGQTYIRRLIVECGEEREEVLIPIVSMGFGLVSEWYECGIPKRLDSRFQCKTRTFSLFNPKKMADGDVPIVISAGRGAETCKPFFMIKHLIYSKNPISTFMGYYGFGIRPVRTVKELKSK